MTTRACVWKSGSLIVEIAPFPLAAAWFTRNLAKIPVETRLPRLRRDDSASRSAGVHSCRISSQTQTEGIHETEYSSGVAGRHRRRGGVGCMGVLRWLWAR